MSYVLIYTQSTASDNVLLVLKDKPDWQKGRLNLPGGKVEDGETPSMAAERELLEEAGYYSFNTRLMGLIEDGGTKIFCYHSFVGQCAFPRPRPEETQKIDWQQWKDVRYDERLIPNLRIIIPLMMAGVRDWVIIDDYRSSTWDQHLLQMKIPTSMKKLH